MKLRTSASTTFLFRDVALYDVVSQALQAGFDALELQLLGPGDAEQLMPHAAAAEMEVALINFGVGDLFSNGPGLSGVPGRVVEFKAALDDAFENARVLEAKVVHVGPSRVPVGIHRDDCIAQLVDNIRRALDKFESLGASLSIEALNEQDFPGVLIGSPDQALEVIEMVGTGGARLGVQYDIYHACMDNRNILHDLRTLLPQIIHVQFADCPGRHEPGTGQVNFGDCFELLRSLEYQGYVGAEYIPSQHVSATLDWMKLL